METKIAYRGWLTVNLPISLMIFISWYLLNEFTDLKFKVCVFIAVAIGWIYWEFAVIKWIKWSLLQGIDKDKLCKIGTRNLLLWNGGKIDRVSEKMNKQK